MNKLTTKKQMQMKTWWAFNFVRQRRKTAKNVGSGTQTIAPIKQTEKSLGPVGSVFKKKF